MAPDKADQILEVVSRNSQALSALGERTARIEERQKDLVDIRGDVRACSARITRLETQGAVTKTKLALIGSLFGAAAAGLVAWIKHLLGGH